jgi:hypothetical protein
MSSDANKSVSDILKETDDNIRKTQATTHSAKYDIGEAYRVFDSEFTRIRKEIIRPTMENIAAELRKHAHGCRIHEPLRYQEDRDRVITLEVTPNSSARDSLGLKDAKASYVADRIDKVLIFVKNEDSAPYSKRAVRMPLSGIDKSSVERQLSEFIRETFDPPKKSGNLQQPYRMPDQEATGSNS